MLYNLTRNKPPLSSFPPLSSSPCTFNSFSALFSVLNSAMEEARHWVWAKRKHGLSSTTDDLYARNKASSYEDSWEEQAFAEDASGPLGGCVWPPRSYSCSFCRREFRSAQALGGHMNVHRRDRARLKQSPPDLHHETLHSNHPQHNNIHVQNINPLITSFGPTQYPSQVCALVYNPNPNSDHDPANFISSPSPCKQSCHDKQALLFPPFSSSSSSSYAFQENNKKIRSSSSISPSSQTWSNLATDRHNDHSSNQKNQLEKISSMTHVESRSFRAKADYHVKTDLSVSLNLVVCHSCPTVSAGKEETLSCKRRRTTESSGPPSPSLKPGSVGSHARVAQSEAFELSPCSIEELDLELRLGGRPYKVK